MTTARGVLDFWLVRKGPSDWYGGGEALDAEIRREFEPLWHRAMAGQLQSWLGDAEGALALLILTDQFSRNMFRGTAGAYASDRLALAAACLSIQQGHDLRTDVPAREFFYMPLMHAESLEQQERCLRLFLLNMPDKDKILHARAHREVIRRFGRFPYRNDHLGRQTRPLEQRFLDAGAYMAMVREIEAQG